MIVAPLVALIGWIPIGLICFRRLPIRHAILLNFVGGWAILPAANYARPATNAFPYWILGTSLESDYLITKATIIGLTGLLGILLFDRSSFKRFKLTVWDVAMGMWLIAPLLSAIANPDNTKEGLAGELYQLLAWGSPYLIGRLYFTDTRSLRIAAQVLRHRAASSTFLSACLKSPKVRGFTLFSTVTNPSKPTAPSAGSATGPSACLKTATSSASGWPPRL